MTIILFLVDTSASMNQRTYLGARPTLLDVAKDAVEKFLKVRTFDAFLHQRIKSRTMVNCEHSLSRRNAKTSRRSHSLTFSAPLQSRSLSSLPFPSPNCDARSLRVLLRSLAPSAQLFTTFCALYSFDNAIRPAVVTAICFLRLKTRRPI